MTDAATLTATHLAARIAAGELSAVEAMQACLARIEAREPGIGAFVHLDPAQALAAAKAADARRAAGRPLGALHGVPVAVKDVIDTADMPTEHGSPIFKGNRPARDAVCVARLRDAGAIVIGKSVTTELASLTPRGTRNPRDLSRTPGGSSSGSAAAVASFMAPLALGTQTAGSVIRPASFCGVHAFKPTLGFIPRGGVLMQSHTLDTVGVYGRSVEDLALAATVMGAHEDDDAASFPGARENLVAALAQPPARKPRLAFVRTPAWSFIEPDAARAYEAFAAMLGADCPVVDLPAAFDGVVEAQALVQSCENTLYYGPLYDRHRDLLSEGMRARLERGFPVGARRYLEAEQGRQRFHDILRPVFADHDALVCPAAPGVAPRGIEATGNPVFNGLWTLLGMPAVSLPLIGIGGLPLGVQLVGPRHGDGALLAQARWLEQRVGRIFAI